MVKNRKGKGQMGDQADVPRRSSRLEAYEDVKVSDMAISRVEAKDAFIHKGTLANLFSVLNTKDMILCEITESLDVSLGCNEREKDESLSLIRSIEEARSNPLLQSVTRKKPHEDVHPQD
jgi:hypothetical protein